MDNTKIHAVMVAVKDLEKSKVLLGKLFNASIGETRYVAEGNMITAYLEFKSGTRIQLMQGQGEDSELRNFINKNGEGLYGLCIEVNDIQATKQWLLEQNEFKIIGDIIDLPTMYEIIVHPKTANGLLTVYRKLK